MKHRYTAPYYISDLPRGRSGHIGEWLLEDEAENEIERATYSDLRPGSREAARKRLEDRLSELEALDRA